MVVQPTFCAGHLLQSTVSYSRTINCLQQLANFKSAYKADYYSAISAFINKVLQPRWNRTNKQQTFDVSLVGQPSNSSYAVRNTFPIRHIQNNTNKIWCDITIRIIKRLTPHWTQIVRSTLRMMINLLVFDMVHWVGWRTKQRSDWQITWSQWSWALNEFL